ncbi:kinase [Rossellomorea sp. AcN35-11]|nr:hypothetical protein [Rossellomorea aquimaris]NMH70853.1 hypothetical protein [Bacillus sp. RO3]WJV30133.1 kinase [Rossellomorea sp. AcN35-11]
MEDHTLSLCDEFLNVEKGQRVILGIDGLSRSGKTTFVTKMEQHLRRNTIPVCIFHMDDFITDRKRRYNTGHEEWFEYYHLQWDAEWITDHLFSELKVAGELNLLIYDESSDSHKEKVVNLPDTSLIIMEGVFLQREEWRAFYDHVIYLDCPREKRFQREKNGTQQKIEKFQKRYWKAEEYYMKTVAPKERADLVIKT